MPQTNRINDQTSLLKKNISSKNIINELVNVFENFYLANVKVVEKVKDNTEVGIGFVKSISAIFSRIKAGCLKKFSSIFGAISLKKKIIKSSDNVKVQLAREIICQLSGIEKSSLSEDKKLDRIKKIISDNCTYYKSKKTKGNFAKASRYAFSYLENLSVENPNLPVKLSSTSEEYQRIISAFKRDVESNKKVSMRFEPSRVLKGDASQVAINILKEIISPPVNFGGKDEFVMVQEIQVLPEDAKITEAYNQAKSDLSSQDIKNRINFGIDIPGLTEQLDHSKNEVYLYHGTSLFSGENIQKEGFNCIKFCTSNSISGYGSLGRGTYFTDELPKAGTFAMCSLCGNHRCNCRNSEGTPYPKAVIICKAVLGNPEIVTTKNSKISQSTAFQNGYHSRIGVSKQIDPISHFNSNEFAILNTNQLLPKYLVLYTHCENMLLQRVWEKTISKHSLKDNEDIGQLSNAISEFNHLVGRESKETILIRINKLNEIKELASAIKEGLPVFKEEIFPIIKLQVEYYINHFVAKLNDLHSESLASAKEEEISRGNYHNNTKEICAQLGCCTQMTSSEHKEIEKISLVLPQHPLKCSMSEECKGPYVSPIPSFYLMRNQ